jgi:hypothetical protein
VGFHDTLYVYSLKLYSYCFSFFFNFGLKKDTFLYEFKFSIVTGVFFALTDLLLFTAFIRLQTYQWSDRVIKTFVRKNWLVKAGVMKREVNMIVTKNVVREVRDYFNCEDLEGAELEDQGEEGTALTHWEKRVFEVEVLKVM